MHPIISRLASSDQFVDVAFGTSDISDRRGYTSFIAKHGVLKLPTIVVFSRGR
jgi:hypothetical protein